MRVPSADAAATFDCAAQPYPRSRTVLAGRQIEPVIPSIRRRKPLIPYDKAIYRQRNLIERRFCRLKDFRRIATRYDKLARNFLASALLAAAVLRWIN